MSTPSSFLRALVVATWLLVLGMPAHSALPIQHWRQPSGAAVYLVESHGIPMVDVQLDFDAGARRDPTGKVGLASATAMMTGKGLAAANGEPVNITSVK